MSKIMKSVVFLSLFAAGGWPRGAFSMEDLPMTKFKEMLGQTLAGNPRVGNAREKLGAAQTLLPQTRSQLLPKVSMGWNNTISSARWKGGGSQSDPTSASLSLTQPLFDLETVRNYRRVVPQVKAVEMDLEGVRQQVFMDFVDQATNVLQGRDVYKLAENNYNLTVSHLQATQARFAAGELTRTDVSQSLARVYSAKAGWIAAKADSQAGKARFAELTGQDGVDDLEVPTVRHEVITKPLAELVELIDQRPDIAAQNLRLQSAQEGIDARKAGYLPTASVSSSGTRSWDPGSGIAGPEDAVSMTLNLSWPLYSGGLTGAKVDEAVSERASQQALLEQARFAAIRELKVALLESEKSAAVDRANGVRVQAAKDALDGVSQEYQVGTRTSLDILDAQNELFGAQTEKIKSGYTLNLTKFKLLKALGVLSLEKIETSLVPQKRDTADDGIILEEIIKSGGMDDLNKALPELMNPVENKTTPTGGDHGVVGGASVDVDSLPREGEAPSSTKPKGKSTVGKGHR